MEPVNTPATLSRRFKVFLTAHREIAMLFLALVALPACLFAQAPSITYPTPDIYYAGTAISPLKPTASGVGSAAYSTGITTLPVGLTNPRGIAVDAAGNIYVADHGNVDIGIITLKKIPVGSSTPVIIASGFGDLGGVAVDAQGNVYTDDPSDGTVYKIPAGGTKVALRKGFSSPAGIAVDGAGNVYVCDSGNNQVKMIPAKGGPLVVIGKGFSGPSGVAVDVSGNVYIVDSQNKLVKEVTPDGSIVTLGSGLIAPTAICIDGTGNLFVIDEGHIVREIQANGHTSVVVQSTAFGFLNYIAVDGYNNVLVTDVAYNKVDKFKPIGGYYISRGLPPGLRFNDNNGIISGIPTVSGPLTHYTVTVYNPYARASAGVNIRVLANPDLLHLAVSNGELSPVFKSSVTSYSVSVPNSISSIKVTPAADDTAATIKVNGTPVKSGALSQAIALVVGHTTVNVIVTGHDGVAKKTYTVVVTRPASPNDNLSALKLSTGKLSPAFAGASISSYTASVPDSVHSVTVTATAVLAASAIKVKGKPVKSGIASAPVALAIGANAINVVVTAPDGTTTKTYTVTVTRAMGPVNIPDETVSVAQPAEGPQFADDGVKVHQGVSINGDGINDFLKIDGIDNYPDNKLMIMSRTGTLVYERNGYDNSSKVFDGRSNKTGARQLPGTYFYSLDYKVKGVTRHKTGFIVLKD